MSAASGLSARRHMWGSSSLSTAPAVGRADTDGSKRYFAPFVLPLFAMSGCNVELHYMNRSSRRFADWKGLRSSPHMSQSLWSNVITVFFLCQVMSDVLLRCFVPWGLDQS